MSKAKQGGCYILVKAQPHRSSKYFETVCCAGVDRDGNWCRQYPVPFRILNDHQKFKRWDYISYKYTSSQTDKRRESQRVLPESLTVSGHLRKIERSHFLSPLIRSSEKEANSLGESLTLLRPEYLEIKWTEKSESEINRERQKHADLANQLSFFDETAKPLEPCSVRFVANWHLGDRRIRRHACDDWETTTAFNRFERNYGRFKAIEILRQKYEQDYFKSGLVLALSTHSRRNITNDMENQWLLVGLIRLDFENQHAFNWQ